MTLVANTQLGPYQIVSPLGAGGMGEVYRARDTRLNRDVAIKVLPATFAADEDHLRRFQQEALATSALNHPNILTVYDIGAHDGAPYIVAELLEGEELREALNHGAIPERKAIEYATEIASGLAAAHAKSIVHRDLKPENIFVTADGRVKILDFGLAKLRTKGPGIGSDSNVQTQKVLTDPGVVLGTVGYMSPEQVRGQETDHRTDIFSFGLILYEMLSGRRAFTGESSIEVMNAILKEQPPELSETNSKTNPALDQIVRRCIEKKPQMRFHSAHDLGFALSTLTTQSGSRLETATALPAVTEAHGLAPLFGNARLAWIAALVLLVVVLSLAAAAYLRPAPAVSRAYKLSVLPVDPDNGNVDVWLTEFTGGSFSRFTFDPVVEFSPVWSPDGSRIAFAAVEGPPNVFQKLSSGAGEVVPLFKSPLAKLPSDWSRDGRYIVCDTVGLTTRYDLWVLSLGGESKFEMFLQTPYNELRACFAPSGRWIAYESDESGKKEVYVRSFPASGATWQVSAGGGAQARFARDGKELFYVSADRKIMAVPVKTDGVSFESSAPKALFDTHILIKEDRPGDQFAVTSDGQRFLINSTLAATGGSPMSVVINWAPEGKK